MPLQNRATPIIFYACMHSCHVHARMEEAVAEGLVDRLDDCKRTFPVAAVINGAGEHQHHGGHEQHLACEFRIDETCASGGSCDKHGVATAMGLEKAPFMGSVDLETITADMCR